jgi:hypothetical protein
MLLERRGEWAHVRCSNGWEAWVDGRRLVESAPTQTAPTVTTPPPPPAQPGPPSAAWGTPAAAPAAAPRATGGFSIGPRQIVALIGGLLFLIASWLPWIRFEFSGGGSSASESFSAYRIPAHFLLDSQSELGGLSLGIVIAFFGVACIAAALLSGLRSVRFLSLVAGGAAFLVVVLFLVQTKYLSDQLPGVVESGYFSVLRLGAYIALLGAIASPVGGVLALVLKRS